MSFGLSDWLNIAWQFASVSLFAIGGAIGLLPEMHQFFVIENKYITEDQFTSGIALAQASPGPNALMMAMLGWGFGINATPVGQSTIPYAVMAFVMSMICILLPSCLLNYTATKWVHKNSERMIVRAFKQGVAPVVVGTMLASSWIIVAHDMNIQIYWPTWLLAFVAVLLVVFTRLHILALLGLGALVGMTGWIA
jgi:chromate transporter